jgi:hypothetical protein
MEHLKSHSYCWECNFFPEDDPELARWHRLEFRGSDTARLRRVEEDRLLRGQAPLGDGLEE